MTNDSLNAFLLSVEGGEIPTDKVLSDIAEGLKSMQAGASFKATFKTKRKPGRKRGKTIMEKRIYEAKPYLEAIDCYRELRKKGRKSPDAISETTEKHKVNERYFDDYLARCNELKSFSKYSEEEFNELAKWQQDYVISELLGSSIEDWEGKPQDLGSALLKRSVPKAMGSTITFLELAKFPELCSNCTKLLAA